MEFKSIKGTRDILPDEVYKWQYVEAKIRDMMSRYNYAEIRTPIFEETGLFTRSIGQLTDIVSKEMYTFQDRGCKSLTLKPEMTAPVVRAYIEHNLGQKAPLVKLYYIAPVFRQENPQAGRFRQFHQYGAEIIGSLNPMLDAENIALALNIYTELGLAGMLLKLNSVGCPGCRESYKKLLRESLKDRLPELCQDCQTRYQKNPLRILDCKKENCRNLTQDVPVMADHLCADCRSHFEQVQSSLQAMGIEYELDKRLVRGLDYYTRTAYEIVSGELGSQDALSGGGRYDLLCQELGGKPTPAVGFAAGIERLLMVMEKQNLFSGEPQRVSVFISALGEKARYWAAQKCKCLRAAGISCDMDFLERSLKAQMREANRQGVKFTLIVGDQELQQGKLTVRNMEKGEQTEIPFDEVEIFLKRELK